MKASGFIRQWPPAVLINSADDWNAIEGHFIRSIGELGMVGFDCEWVEPDNFVQKEKRGYWRPYTNSSTFNNDTDAIRISNGSSGKVALLQLASHQGMVLLIRLCFFTEIPLSLNRFLENGEIFKLGVNTELDAKKLFEDWDINTNGFVDIRNVVVRNPRFLEEYEKSGLGLKKLGNFLTGSNCDESKDNKVRYSHWAARELNAEQIQYARSDAVVAVEGIVCFATKYMDDLPDPSASADFAKTVRKALLSQVNRTCSEYVTRILDHKKEAVDEDGEPATVSRKAEERRRRREENSALGSSDSDIEFDYDLWTKSGHCRKARMKEGVMRAILFRDDQQKPLAAIDSALLDAMKEADDPCRMRFDVKNEKGAAIYEVRVDLKKLDT